MNFSLVYERRKSGKNICNSSLSSQRVRVLKFVRVLEFSEFSSGSRVRVHREFLSSPWVLRGSSFRVRVRVLVFEFSPSSSSRVFRESSNSPKGRVFDFELCEFSASSRVRVLDFFGGSGSRIWVLQILDFFESPSSRIQIRVLRVLESSGRSSFRFRVVQVLEFEIISISSRVRVLEFEFYVFSSSPNVFEFEFSASSRVVVLREFFTYSRILEFEFSNSSPPRVPVLELSEISSSPRVLEHSEFEPPLSRLTNSTGSFSQTADQVHKTQSNPQTAINKWRVRSIETKRNQRKSLLRIEEETVLLDNRQLLQHKDIWKLCNKLLLLCCKWIF